MAATAPPLRAGFGRAAASLAIACGLLHAEGAGAGEADVVAVDVSCDAERVCRFAVRVRHADAGWEHYADRWEVLDSSGEILATRMLRHPHVDEQPFTRDLAGVKVPAGVRRVRVRAHDSVHGHGGAEVAVEVPGAEPDRAREAP